MSDRSPHTVRCNDEVWSRFVDWVEDVEGQKHGEIGRHVETALREYINEDRQARLERNQHEMQEQLSDLRALLDERGSTHTHKADTECSNADVITAIHEEIVHTADKAAVKDELVERAIKKVAELPVGDDRTIRRYKRKLRQRGLLWEHPGDPPLWTEDRDLWARWATGATHSRDALEAAVEPYPAQVYENGSGLQIEIEEVEI